MIVTACVTEIVKNQYRVAVNQLVSMPILALESAVNLKISDSVLCFFSGNTLTDGVIIGKVVS